VGNYVYTMRKKLQGIFVDGRKVMANLYSYSYKPGGSWWYEQMKGRIAQAETMAERAFDEYREKGGPNYVIVGDLERGVAGLDGCTVYKDVKRATWTDCNVFPGTPVGFLRLKGPRTKLTLTDSIPWWRADSPRDREFRQIVIDGKIVEQVRIDCPKCDRTGYLPSMRECNFCADGYITREQRADLDRIEEAQAPTFGMSNLELAS